MNGANTVLVVDDDDAIRLLCRINLELDGHTVIEAASLAAARRALAENRVSVVLLDVQVGADDGLELLREIRSERPDVKVAMLTGSTHPELAQSARPDAMLGKPFALDELRGTVQELGIRV